MMISCTSEWNHPLNVKISIIITALSGRRDGNWSASEEPFGPPPRSKTLGSDTRSTEYHRYDSVVISFSSLLWLTSPKQRIVIEYIRGVIAPPGCLAKLGSPAGIGGVVVFFRSYPTVDDTDKFGHHDTTAPQPGFFLRGGPARTHPGGGGSGRDTPVGGRVSLPFWVPGGTPKIGGIHPKNDTKNSKCK